MRTQSLIVKQYKTVHSCKWLGPCHHSLTVWLLYILKRCLFCCNYCCS